MVSWESISDWTLVVAIWVRPHGQSDVQKAHLDFWPRSPPPFEGLVPRAGGGFWVDGLPLPVAWPPVFPGHCSTPVRSRVGTWVA